MRTFAYTPSVAGARTVRELITTDGAGAKHPSVTDLLATTDLYSSAFLADCVEVTSVSPAPAERWTYDGAAFAAPVNTPGPVNCYAEDFTNQTTVTLAHNMATEDVTTQVWSGAAPNKSRVEPATTKVVDANTVEITFAAPTSGRAILCAVR